MSRYIPRQYRGINVNTPFGFIMPNGMNLAQSVFNPNSLLRRVLTLLKDGDMTKAGILNSLGYTVNVLDRRVRSGTRWLSCKCNSYHANAFSAMVKGGFVRHYRKGRKVYWTLGPRVSDPDLFINL